MKPIRILIFIFSVILLLVVAWYYFPAEGLAVGNHTLRFPSYEEDMDPTKEKKEINVDSVIHKVDQSQIINYSDNLLDSLRSYRSYLKENPNRIYLPNDDYTFFDTLFYQLEHANEEGKTYRIMHYGDSQIEMDRISSVLRQNLQTLFGGSGPNMIPAIQPVATISVTQNATNLNRYMVYGDAPRARHNRYGVMAQFSQVIGNGSISFIQTSHSQAYPKVKQISTVSVLLGKNSQGFSATLKCQQIPSETKVLAANDGVSLITWILPENVKRGTINFVGNAEIYAVLLDDDAGVAVDNVALRGCSGNIFSLINENTLRQSFDLLNTRLIILQFGGNRMPGISSLNSISAYMDELEKQIKYLKRVAPEATMLFIGPADMGKSYNGKMGTWKNLPELNDSLRAMTLRNNVAYWDMFHVMGGEGSMVHWVKHTPPYAGPDYVHFTFKGAQEIGNQLAKSFTTYYDFYKLRQHVPSDKVIEFINLDQKEDSIQTARRIKMPFYQPDYVTKKR